MIDSCQPIGPSRAHISSVPVTPWRKMFGPTTADNDGTPLLNPYNNASFRSTTCKEVHVSTSGRTLLNTRGASHFEILPLFDAAEGNVTLRLWAFDWVQPAPNNISPDSLAFPLAASTNTKQPGEAAVALGLPYLLKNDSSLALSTLTLIASEAIPMKVSFSGPIPYHDATSGTTYYYGARYPFAAAGFYAVWPWVTAIATATNVVLLGRWI